MIDALKEWHDFFVVMAAAAGTLMGSMFVVVSIGSGLVKESAPASRLFVTPIIIHLGVALMLCALVLVPSLTRVGFGMAMAGAGVVFLVYASRNLFLIRRRDAVEWSDHLWYGFCPPLAYLIVIVGSAMVLTTMDGAIEVIAFALALLVVSGIRNAWDLILFFLEKRGENQSED
jgi:uncharacterized membrane protein